MPRATIPVDHIAILIKLLQRNDVDTSSVLRAAHISPALLGAPLARITHQQFGAAIRRMVRLTHDELWGLGNRTVPMGSFAATCRLAVQEATLEDALRAGLHQYRLHARDVTARLAVIDGVARIRVVTSLQDADASRMIHSAYLFFLYSLMCWFIGKRVPLLAVDCAFARASLNDDAIRVFRTTVRFNQPATELRFEAKCLRSAGVQDGTSVERLLRLSPGILGVGFREHADTTQRVTRLLRRNLESSIDLDTAARMLAVSGPTLRRKLAAEHQTFRYLKDAVRCDAAIDALANSNQSIEKIGSTLGFEDASTFYRAFKRWTGGTPNDYRRSKQS